jgi:hypothetical protein
MKRILFAAAALALVAGAANAQPAGKMGARADGDGDGKITLSEFRTARVTQMMKLDANKDGKVSKAEFDARGQGRGAPEGKPKGDGSRMFGMLDTNKDGALDKAELGKMAEKRFARMDADGDGVLSAAERQSARQGARGMMGGGR